MSAENEPVSFFRKPHSDEKSFQKVCSNTRNLSFANRRTQISKADPLFCRGLGTVVRSQASHRPCKNSARSQESQKRCIFLSLESFVFTKHKGFQVEVWLRALRGTVCENRENNNPFSPSTLVLGVELLGGWAQARSRSIIRQNGPDPLEINN